MAPVKGLLPFYGSAEDVVKIANYLKTKPMGATDRELAATLGRNFADPRKFDFYDVVGLFAREAGTFRLSERGLKYLASDEQSQNELIRDSLRGFKPYHSVIAWAFHGDVKNLDADQVRHFWAHKFAGEIDLENKYRLQSAPGPFFAVCDMAGLGSFLIGRRGAKSRLELNRVETEEYLHAPASAESTHPDSATIEPKTAAETVDTVLAQPVPGSPSVGQRVDTSQSSREYSFNIPVFGKTARLIWSEPSLTVKEWEKVKKVGDAMFLDQD